MEMPLKFRKFIGLIKDGLFYITDDIVVIEESAITKLNLSESDIKLAINLLKKKGAVLKYNVFDVLKFKTIPLEYDRKLYMLDNVGIASGFGANFRKAQYVIRVDRGKFLELYGDNKNSGKKENVTKGLYFDADKSILFVGNTKILIKRKNENPIEHYVLQYMFENEEGIDAKAYYSEMADSPLFKKYGVDGKDTRSYWRACTHIQDKALKEGVKNLLTVRSGISGWAQINSKYLQN